MIKAVRLINGEVLLGEVVEHDDASITIDKPASIQLQQVGPSQLGVAMVPYNPWVVGPIVIWKSSLMGPANNVDEHTINTYNERFNPSGIITPPKAGILLG